MIDTVLRKKGGVLYDSAVLELHKVRDEFAIRSDEELSKREGSSGGGTMADITTL